MQDIVDGGSVQIGRCGGAAPVDEREGGRECLDGAGDAVAARAAQLDEILRRGKGDEKTSAVAEDTPEFARIHPRRDGEDDGERAAGVGRWRSALATTHSQPG